MTYQDALRKAQTQSANDECVQHVNVIMDRADSGAQDEPTIAGYYVSDWADNATVASFENGEQC